MENSIRLIKQVERTHKGLGIPILWINLSGSSFVSSIISSLSGTGKKVISESLRAPVEKEFMYNTNGLTITSFARKLLQVNQSNPKLKMLIEKLGYAIPIFQQKLCVLIPDLITLAPYDLDLFQKIISFVISEHYYDKEIRTGERIYLKECDLEAFVIVQPDILNSELLKNRAFDSLMNDRYTKFTNINPFKENTVLSNPEFDYNPMDYDLTIDSVSHEFRSDFPIISNLSLTKKLLAPQMTLNSARTETYAKALLRAFAIFEGYEKVDIKTELEFRKLFGAYLKFYNDMLYTEELGGKLMFNLPVYSLTLDIINQRMTTRENELDRFKYRKAQLKAEKEQDTKPEIINTEKSKWSKWKKLERIEDIAKQSEELGYITIEQNSPITYRISDTFQKEFIDFHEELVK